MSLTKQYQLFADHLFMSKNRCLSRPREGRPARCAVPRNSSCCHSRARAKDARGTVSLSDPQGCCLSRARAKDARPDSCRGNRRICCLSRARAKDAPRVGALPFSGSRVLPQARRNAGLDAAGSGTDPKIVVKEHGITTRTERIPSTATWLKVPFGCTRFPASWCTAPCRSRCTQD